MCIFTNPSAEYETPGDPEELGPETKKFLLTVVAAIGWFLEDMAEAKLAAVDQPAEDQHVEAEKLRNLDDYWPNSRLWM